MPSARDNRNLMSQRDTPESQTLPEGGHIDKPAIPGINSTRPRIRAGDCKLTVRETTRKAMNLRDGYEPVNIRRENWQGLGHDRPSEFIDDNDGAYVPIKSGTDKPWTNGDLIVAARPIEVREQIEAREREAANEWAKEQNLDAETDRMRDDSGAIIENEKQMANIRNQNAKMFKQMAMNSPTAGMDLFTASDRFTEKQIETQEMQAALGGRDSPAMRDAWQNAKDKTIEKFKAEAKGRGNSFSIGATFDSAGRVVR